MIEILDFAMRASGFVFSVAAMIIAYVRTRQSDIDTRFEKITDQIDVRFDKIKAEFLRREDWMDQHERRISALERDVEGLPGRQDIHQIEMHIAEMNGDLKQIDTRLAGTRETMSRVTMVLDRVETHLLKEKS